MIDEHVAESRAHKATYAYSFENETYRLIFSKKWFLSIRMRPYPPQTLSPRPRRTAALTLARHHGDDTPL